jgi:hypothetical protein
MHAPWPPAAGCQLQRLGDYHHCHFFHGLGGHQLLDEQ